MRSRFGAGTAPLGTLVASRLGARAVTSLELIFQRVRAATLWRDRLPALQLVCGDVFTLPFAPATFDCVVANSVLHHFPDLSSAIREIGRMLRPGGIYVGREPNFDNPIVRFGVFNPLGNKLFRTSHSANEYPLRPREIVRGFANAGCDCELRFFWRRLPRFTQRILVVAMSVRARKAA